ncbi:hypothetical protein LTR15_006657 [Elasticomyces elasticus]|nr:hypothetical protein LTR15_006657 [Elasticomyces elasticus]
MICDRESARTIWSKPQRGHLRAERKTYGVLRTFYPSAITQTCREIRSEAGKLFFSCNTFSIRGSQYEEPRHRGCGIPILYAERVVTHVLRDYNDFATTFTLRNARICREIQIESPLRSWRSVPQGASWTTRAEPLVESIKALHEHAMGLLAPNLVICVQMGIHEDGVEISGQRTRIPLARPNEAIIAWATELEAGKLQAVCCYGK